MRILRDAGLFLLTVAELIWSRIECFFYGHQWQYTDRRLITEFCSHCTATKVDWKRTRANDKMWRINNNNNENTNGTTNAHARK